MQPDKQHRIPRLILVEAELVVVVWVNLELREVGPRVSAMQAHLLGPVYGAVSCAIKGLNSLELILNTASRHEAAKLAHCSCGLDA